MPIIHLTTRIHAPITRCFDLSRSIDLHKRSTAHTQEEAIAGVTSGLFDLDETVTWRASHFGIWHRLTSKITVYNRPTNFTDEMQKGIFKSFRHDHLFESQGDETIMNDRFDYMSPLGFLGEMADGLFLEKYMTDLLMHRNQIIKQFAESEKWREVLP